MKSETYTVQKFGGYFTLSNELLKTAGGSLIRQIAERTADNAIAGRGYRRIGAVEVRPLLNWDVSPDYKMYCVTARAVPEEPQYGFSQYQLGGKAC